MACLEGRGVGNDATETAPGFDAILFIVVAAVRATDDTLLVSKL